MKRWLLIPAALALALVGTAGVLPCEVLAQAPALVPRADPATALPPKPVQAPHWGDALFRFYQGDALSTLDALAVSTHFGRLPMHESDAELLRGGVLLAWGQHDEAAALFERLLADPKLGPVHDRAWFYLARVRHERGNWAQAEAALARLGTRTLPLELQAERVLLAAQLRMQQGDMAAAAALLSQPLANGTATEAVLTARYNLGVAWLRQGDVVQGRQWLGLVGQHSPAASEEQRALRDRANVALGFAALQAGQPLDAELALSRVRLQGSEASRALLALGWAHSSAGRPRNAMVAWQVLAPSNPANTAAATLDSATLEAHLALPHALAGMDAAAQALAGYEAALAHYGQQHLALAAAMAAVKDGSFMNALIGANPSPAMHALSAATTLPKATVPYTAQLAPLMAGHDFQAGWRHLRDLRHLGQRLEAGQGELATYTTMLAERQAAFAARLPNTQQAAAQRPLAPLQARHAELKAQFDKAVLDGDWVALADAPLAALHQRIQRARRLLQGQGEVLPADERAALAERLRLAEGAFTFTLAQGHAGRVWQAQKGLRDGERQLANAAERDARLALAQVEEPKRLQAFADRIATLQARVETLQPRLAALATEQQVALQDGLAGELVRLQERLDGYGIEARWAKAQLLDRAQAESPIAQQQTNRDKARDATPR